MLNLGDIYTRVLEILNKDQYGAYVTPYNFNNTISWVNIIKMNELLKVFEEKREISRDLQPFIITLGSPDYPAINLDTYGYGEYPEDYYYFARSSYMQYLNHCGGFSSNARMVQFIDQQDFNYRISTELLAPTMDNPIAVDENDKFLVRPLGIQSVAFTYVKNPTNPYFDYDLIDGVVVYLPPNEPHVNSSVLPVGTISESVEFEYPLPVYNDLANLIIQDFSKKIRSEFTLQTSPTTQGQ
jgi:hypothetical protein